MPNATLFSKAHKAALEAVWVEQSNERKALIPTLPDNYTLNDLNVYISNLDKSSLGGTLAAFRVLDASLNEERLHQTNNDIPCATSLCDQIVALLRPNAELFVDGHPNYKEDDGPRKQWRIRSLLGLNSLSRILDLSANQIKLKSSLLLSLVVLTNQEDAWSSREAREIASGILGRHGQRAFTTTFITREILEDYIRPLFKNSKPITVTEQGRKQTVEPLPNQKSFASHLYDPARKPWKYRDIGSITIFRWAVTNSDKELMASNWHLFIPPLLTLLDDPSTPIRLFGMAALLDFLDKIPPKMLEQTGLGDVMEEAMIPTLSFLPTLTPVDESLLLLHAAYDTLLKLADVRFGDQKSKQKKQKLLDKLLREGVLHGMDHCQQQVEIMRLLLGVMRELLNRSGIQSIRHLKDITPILYTQLTDPFAPTNPDNLVRAVQVLQGIILNCWPVLSEDRHRIEVLKAISVCWIHVNDEMNSSTSRTSEQLLKAKNDLKVTATLLSKAMPEFSPFTKEVEQLVGVESRVASLFT